MKNIIFDLGGVLLDINPGLSILAFRELGMPDLIRPGGWSYDHEVFLKMEQGLLTETEFREEIRSLLGQPVSDHQIDHAWCSMLIDFSEENIRLLQQLRATYKLYLFSNTNSIHVNYFQELFLRKFGFPLARLFVKDYYSNVIKLRKPDPRSFRFVLDDAGLNPEETLFIDDLDKNTEAAASVGMHAIQLKPGMDLVSLFGSRFKVQGS